MRTTLYASRSRGQLLVVFCLCLCVMAQMLGAPVTLLSPADASDLLGSSVLEGFSVVPPSPELILPKISIGILDFSPSVSVLVIAATLFRPPVR
ncbi:MAG: hypothetical protein Q7U39_01200 [Nitrospira sp.]|nr:hypothetical protein [Nitrospira sp.]